MTTNQQHLFIGGAWRPATGSDQTPVTDSYTEQVFASYRTASHADVDAAVRSASNAFPLWCAAPVPERIAAVRPVAAALRERADTISRVISREVGMSSAPCWC